MKFHALLPVRDEADIIEQCLDHLLTWADAVYVFDTGSVDDTWAIVQEVASSDARVTPMRKDAVYFSDVRLRGYMFNRARRHMEHGDWFLRVDADEFHHIPPPVFVEEHMRSHETIAYHQYYDFELTQQEVEAWERGEETLADRQRPIEQRRRHFTISKYSEPRLCRYRETMKWPLGCSFPINAGYVARKRLPIRHYPHRDPVQLDRRCRLRAIMMDRESAQQEWSNLEEHHWTESDWRSFVASATDPEVHYWEPGTELPDPRYANHLAPWYKRIVQRIVHAAFLPVLDRMRDSFSDDAYPEPIPEEVDELLHRALAVEPSSSPDAM